MALGPLLLHLVPNAHAASAAAAPVPAPVLIGGIVLVLGLALWATYKDLLGGMVLTAGLGAVTTIYLTVQHFAALKGGSSMCNISSVINCDLINTSAHSELGGVAISLYGLGFYAAMGYLAFRQRAGRTDSAGALLLLGAIVATLYDVFLAHASYQLSAICLFCAASWALNVILLGSSIFLVKRSTTPFSALLGKSVGADLGPAVVMGLSVFIVGLVATRGSSEAELAIDGGSPNWASLYEQARGPVVLRGNEPVKGDPTARFTLVEFADYQCPHCGLMAPTLKKVIADNPDTKLIFKHYPISNVCNSNVDGDRHPFACGAAAAAECARSQGRFWELSDAMFKNQAYLSFDDIKFMAGKQGVDLPSLELCTSSGSAMDVVRDDTVAAAKAQIDGTPSVFLHGAFGDQWVRLLVSADDGDKITALIAAARSGEALPAPGSPAPFPE